MLDIVTGIELEARKLGSDEAEELRGRVCGILRKAELPKDNLTREQRKAIGELESLENIAITLGRWYKVIREKLATFC